MLSGQKHVSSCTLPVSQQLEVVVTHALTTTFRPPFCLLTKLGCAQLLINSPHDVKICLPQVPDADRPLLLFLHGFLGSRTDWVPVMAHLASSARCIAIDLPGHGQTTVLPTAHKFEELGSNQSPDYAPSLDDGFSDAPQAAVLSADKLERPDVSRMGDGVSQAYVMESVGEAIAALIGRLRTDGQRVVVVGYSMGARVALYLAAKHPELVSRETSVIPKDFNVRRQGY